MSAYGKSKIPIELYKFGISGDRCPLNSYSFEDRCAHPFYPNFTNSFMLWSEIENRLILATE